MKKIIALLLAVITILSAAGCAATPAKPGIGDDIKPNDVSVTDLDDAFALLVNNFSIELAKRAFDEGSNNIASPISVLLALSMAQNGAEGDTLAQFEALNGLDRDTVNNLLYSYIQRINSTEKAKVNIANSIWLNSAHASSVKDSFLQANADYYNADVYNEAFDKKTVKLVNDWIEDKTDGLIKDVLQQLDPVTVMLLVNAIVFDAKWSDPYEDYQIDDGIFNSHDGKKQDVKFMSSIEGIYLEDENATGFMKPYEFGEYYFVALLPKEGMTAKEYLDTLTGEKFGNIIKNSSREYEVITKTPKFKSRYNKALNSYLKDMGLDIAFDPNRADFSAMCEDPLHIGTVIHEGYIEVDELGTKAGAVTIISMDACAAFDEEPPKYKYVTLDRPFVYAIVDNSTKTPLFMGTLNSVD